VIGRDDVIVLDTNILIHLARNKPAGRYIAARYGLISAPLLPLICVVTLGECFVFADYHGWGAPKKDELRTRLSELVVVDIHNQAVIEAYAELDIASRRMGKRMSKNDLWIAAVAKTQDAVLLTTDKDFEHLDSGHIRVEYVPNETLPRGKP
jgi:tRNA(fMet)-specific endonuclease VapC